MRKLQWSCVGAALCVLLLATSVLAQESSSPSPSRPSPVRESIDPTENVKALSEAASKRQDDLRAAAEKLNEARLTASEKLNEERIKHVQELAASVDLRLSNEAKIRAEQSERLAVAEAKRIDAIRAVDVNAVAVNSQRTAEQTTALATQTSQSAEVLRNQAAQSAEALRALVASTAAAAAATQLQQFNALSLRITTLEQAGNEAKGKQTFQDPAFAALISEVRSLAQSRTATAGTDQGRSDVVAWIAGAIGLIGSMGMLFFGFTAMRARQEPALVHRRR